ncbi:MAG: tRNA (adenosine(37)-N6)-threonylcarbamoyltransferase complex dimerization subunit type 1 TsaB [Saprospiraceae bacterium]
MSRILHIESATAVCSVALSEGGRLLNLQAAEELNAHGEKMTRLIERCLAEADFGMEELDAVSVSAGPGSYTALRVGAATAKGICYALGKPLIKVETLKALAWGIREALDGVDALYCPMIDARRMEVYTAVFSKDLETMLPVHSMIVEEGSFDEWFAKGKLVVFGGDGAGKCASILRNPAGRFIEVAMSARHMIGLAQAAWEAGTFEDVAYFSPLYLKPPNITQPKQNWF